jgi:glycosyltransferase involved in cell wall biosynthesis
MSRIVLFYREVLGGVHTYISNLAAWFQEKEINNYVIVGYETGNGLTTVKKHGAGSNSISIRFSPYATIISTYDDLLAEIKDDDVLVCNDSLELEAINHRKLTNKVIYILHGDLVHYYNILTQYQNIIDHVFCVSRGLKVKYSQLFPGLPFSVSYVLINNFQPASFDDEKKPLKLIFIGRFEKMKGADDFLEAFKMLQGRNISVQCFVYTTTFGTDKTLLEQLSPDARLFLDSPNSEVLAALEIMDVLVFPSRSEGLGIVVLEAMKRGVAPIARALPIGIPDMIENNKTGFLINDATDITSAVEMLHLNRPLLQQIKQKANDFANTYFDREKLGNEFVTNTNSTIRKEKVFVVQKKRWPEYILPEPLYRYCKLVYHKVW